MIGIYLMGFVILVSGVGVLGMAIAYAVRPTESKLALLRPLSLAAIFAALCSMSVGPGYCTEGAGRRRSQPGEHARDAGRPVRVVDPAICGVCVSLGRVAARGRRSAPPGVIAPRFSPVYTRLAPVCFTGRHRLPGSSLPARHAARRALMNDSAAIVQEILRGYVLPVRGEHGVVHWARVLENGLRISEATRADPVVVTLFALFHDSRRVNQQRDDGHGNWGRLAARALRGTLVHLDDARFELLYEACRLHTDGLTEGDSTVVTCWDADRLDLGRVGIPPKPKRLCTDAARELRPWAHARAEAGYEPVAVPSKAWGIEAIGRLTERPETRLVWGGHAPSGPSGPDGHHGLDSILRTLSSI